MLFFFRDIYVGHPVDQLTSPILPHAHTILLKHAVNLKRKRALHTNRRRFHHPIVDVRITLAHRHRMLGGRGRTLVLTLRDLF